MPIEVVAREARPEGVSQKQSLLIGGRPNAPRRRRNAKRARAPVVGAALMWCKL